MDAHQSQSILFELLRSFTTLARTLNLSHAVAELNSTRQTVRRHVSLLEKMLGEDLFELRNRQYHLTESGVRVLPEAEDLLARAQGWVSGQTRLVNGLFAATYTTHPDFDYFQQCHPISAAFQSSSFLIREGVAAWANAAGELEHPAMQGIRDYLLVYRYFSDNWVLAEIGPESSYASWFGWVTARSNVGVPLTKMPFGSIVGHLIEMPFREVAKSHGLWFDHVHTQVKRTPDGPFVPISYQRLLMGCRFPDSSFALVTLIDRTHDIVIEGLSSDRIQSMPSDLAMNIATFSPKLRSIRI